MWVELGRPAVFDVTSSRKKEHGALKTESLESPRESVNGNTYFFLLNDYITSLRQQRFALANSFSRFGYVCVSLWLEKTKNCGNSLETIAYRNRRRPAYTHIFHPFFSCRHFLFQPLSLSTLKKQSKKHRKKAKK